MPRCLQVLGARLSVSDEAKLAAEAVGALQGWRDWHAQRAPGAGGSGVQLVGAAAPLPRGSLQATAA